MNPVGYAPIPQHLISQIAASEIVVDPPLVVMAAVTNADGQRILASEFSQEFKLGSLENVRRLRATGVTITAGTDSPLGNLRFGESLQRELDCWSRLVCLLRRQSRQLPAGWLGS